MPVSDPAKERARAEGERRFSLGAARNENEHDEGYGPWHPVTPAYLDYHRMTLHLMQREGLYLPLTAPPSPCPECGGSGNWKTYPGPAGGECQIDCDNCHGSGTIQPDSIFARIDAGDPEWLKLLGVEG